MDTYEELEKILRVEDARAYRRQLKGQILEYDKELGALKKSNAYRPTWNRLISNHKHKVASQIFMHHPDKEMKEISKLLDLDNLSKKDRRYLHNRWKKCEKKLNSAQWLWRANYADRWAIRGTAEKMEEKDMFLAYFDILKIIKEAP